MEPFLLCAAFGILTLVLQGLTLSLLYWTELSPGQFRLNRWRQPMVSPLFVVTSKSTTGAVWTSVPVPKPVAVSMFESMLMEPTVKSVKLVKSEPLLALKKAA